MVVLNRKHPDGPTPKMCHLRQIWLMAVNEIVLWLGSNMMLFCVRNSQTWLFLLQLYIWLFFELGNEILSIYLAFWNNLSVVTKMGELSEVCDRLSSELENRCPDYLNFCKSIGMVKDPYNNKDYSGRYCDKLLKNLDKLDDVVGEEPSLTRPTSSSPMFPRSLPGLARGCFSSQKRWWRQPTQNLKLSERGTKFWMLRVNSMVKIY